MEKIFEARTEQEAVELAVREFGVNAEFIEVEILEKQKGSLFGNKQGKTVIKASVIGLPSTEDGERKSEGAKVPTAVYENEEPKQDASKEHSEQICGIVKDLVGKLGIEISCSFGIENNFYVVTMDAQEEEDQNLLIGRHGKNIEAIQNLSNSIIQNQVDGFPDHIVIDIEKYRTKRTEWLSSIARKKSAQVLKTGKSYLLDELGPFDRKLIHNVVKEFNGVTTTSKGNGYYKRVKILSEDESAIPEAE